MDTVVREYENITGPFECDTLTAVVLFIVKATVANTFPSQIPAV